MNRAEEPARQVSGAGAFRRPSLGVTAVWQANAQTQAHEQNKGAGAIHAKGSWVWGIGVAFQVSGGRDLVQRLKLHDIGGALADLLLPAVFFGIAGALEFRALRRSGTRRLSHWFAFIPVAIPLALAAYAGISLAW